IGSLNAQDATPTDTPIPTDTPTDAPPTVAPTTDVPTDAPTQEPTTAAPTDAPTTAPTDVPTDMPTQDATLAATESPTPEPTAPPTAPSDPPVFNFLNGTTFEGTAGTPLTISGSVSDSLGVVRLVAEGSTGTVNVTTIDPTETSAPYTTAFTLDYSAPAD